MWQVCSGDILQFGVDVMENSRKVGDNLFKKLFFIGWAHVCF
jgi:hypothetical protein